MFDPVSKKIMLGFSTAKAQRATGYNVNPTGMARAEKRPSALSCWPSEIPAHFHNGFLPRSKQWSLVTRCSPVALATGSKLDKVLILLFMAVV